MFATPPDHPVTHKQAFLATEHGVVGARGIKGMTNAPLWAHSSAQEIENYIGKRKFNEYLKIYSIRNPFDKVVSWFWHVAPEKLRVELEADPDRMQWFFRNWLRMRPTLPIDRQFYKTTQGMFDAETIRYESLGEDLLRLSEKLDLKLPADSMPTWKSGARRNRDIGLKDLYDKDTAGLVRKSYRFDFERFGYDTAVPE